MSSQKVVHHISKEDGSGGISLTNTTAGSETIVQVVISSHSLCYIRLSSPKNTNISVGHPVLT